MRCPSPLRSALPLPGLSPLQAPAAAQAVAAFAPGQPGPACARGPCMLPAATEAPDSARTPIRTRARARARTPTRTSGPATIGFSTCSMLAGGALLAALLALPGCARLKAKFAPEPAGFVAPERPNDSCNSAPYRRYLGRPSHELADLVFGGPVRWLQAGETPGEDYDPVRLNIELDALGTVTRLWCG